jgi:hypothetical protein
MSIFDGIFKKNQDQSGVLNEFYWEKISDIKPKDMFIAGYPKSGNTWLQFLMCGILCRMDMSVTTQNMVRDIVPDIQFNDRYRRYFSEMCFKTHSAPAPNMKKVIHVVRDGRDAYCSYYAMLQAQGENVSMEDLIHARLNFPGMGWSSHYDQWKNNPFDSEILLVKYEDLLDDGLNQMKRLAAFAEADIDDELLKKIYLNCSFNEMQEKEKDNWLKKGEWKEGWKFVRKGKSGSYKTEMTEDQVKEFNHINEKQLRELNYHV